MNTLRRRRVYFVEDIISPVTEWIKAYTRPREDNAVVSAIELLPGDAVVVEAEYNQMKRELAVYEGLVRHLRNTMENEVITPQLVERWYHYGTERLNSLSQPEIEPQIFHPKIVKEENT